MAGEQRGRVLAVPPSKSSVVDVRSQEAEPKSTTWLQPAIAMGAQRRLLRFGALHPARPAAAEGERHRLLGVRRLAAEPLTASSLTKTRGLIVQA